MIYLLAPVWLFLFFFLPLAYVFILAFLSKGTYGGIEWVFSLKAIERVLSLQYLEIFFRTLWMAFITAFLCVILGSLCAWFISTRSKRNQDVWTLLFILPFLLNSLIRLYALQSFVGQSGPVQGIVRLFNQGFHSLTWSHNQTVMYLGLVLTYLPFTILPLRAAFEKWEPDFFEAALDLGANLWQNFIFIVLPQLSSSLKTSFFIVFIPCLGEYLVPEILGGSQKIYWGQLIAEAFLKWRDWPTGSAFGILLILGIGFIFRLEHMRNQKV